MDDGSDDDSFEDAIEWNPAQKSFRSLPSAPVAVKKPQSAYVGTKSRTHHGVFSPGPGAPGAKPSGSGGVSRLAVHHHHPAPRSASEPGGLQSHAGGRGGQQQPGGGSLHGGLVPSAGPTLSEVSTSAGTPALASNPQLIGVSAPSLQVGAQSTGPSVPRVHTSNALASAAAQRRSQSLHSGRGPKPRGSTAEISVNSEPAAAGHLRDQPGATGEAHPQVLMPELNKSPPSGAASSISSRGPNDSLKRPLKRLGSHHRRNKSAPAAMPPLPNDWGEMSEFDKEAVLREYSSYHPPSHVNDSNPLGNPAYVPAPSSVATSNDEHYPEALKEAFNGILQGKQPASPRGNNTALLDDEGATKGATVATQTVRDSFRRGLGPGSPGPLLDEEDEEKTEEEKVDSPATRTPGGGLTSWSLFAESQPDTVKEEKKRKKAYSAKAKATGKKQRDFEFVRMEQMIVEHDGPIWTMKFNSEGRYLATGGQDTIVRVWTVVGNSMDKARWKRRPRKRRHTMEVNTTLGQTRDSHETPGGPNSLLGGTQSVPAPSPAPKAEPRPPKGAIINPIPYREYHGHKADVIDIDWCHGTDFILSSSLDSTVMLWHTTKDKCLCIFQHADYVTSVRFHPTNSTYFVSASFDSRIRLWNILDHRVVAWYQLDTLVTAVTFAPNGKFVVAGLYNGQCVFLRLDMDRLRLTWFQMKDCRNGRRAGKKVTSIQYHPMKTGEVDPKHHQGSHQCLVTTNDSRIRLFTLENYQINSTTKYKGLKNGQLQIGASFSHDGKFVICGSDCGGIFIWTKEPSTQTPFMSFRANRRKNKAYEVIRPPGKKVTQTAAIFAPPRTIKYVNRERETRPDEIPATPNIEHLILSADKEGVIRVFTNYVAKPPNFARAASKSLPNRGRSHKGSKLI